MKELCQSQRRGEIAPLIVLEANATQSDTILSGKIVRTNGYVCQSSGSTLSLIMFIQGRFRRWSITVNIGDSEALLVFPKQNKIHVPPKVHF